MGLVPCHEYMLCELCDLCFVNCSILVSRGHDRKHIDDYLESRQKPDIDYDGQSEYSSSINNAYVQWVSIDTIYYAIYSIVCLTG